MPIEKKATARANNPTQPNRRGIIGARRVAGITATGTIVPIPPKAKAVFLRADGAEDVLLNFDIQPKPQHYTIEAGKQTETFGILPSTDINVWAKPGKTTIVEAVFWG